MKVDFSNLFSVQGKIALVTGGSRGIGEMIAAGLLSAGCKVYISSRKAEVCDATAKRLENDYGSECISLPADVSGLQGIEKLANSLIEKEEKLDILVNNAGAAWGAPLEEFPEVGWDKVMDTNVKGAFFLTKALVDHLRKAASAEDPARVINIGSIDGLRAAEFETYSYGASKAAVHHLTRFLAARLTKEHIHFNNIAPGPYPTWMLSTGIGAGGEVDGVDWDAIGKINPSGRVGTPQDIAGLVQFLCSRAGAYVVGETIASDGGIFATNASIG